MQGHRFRRLAAGGLKRYLGSTAAQGSRVPAGVRLRKKTSVAEAKIAAAAKAGAAGGGFAKTGRGSVGRVRAKTAGAAAARVSAVRGKAVKIGARKMGAVKNAASRVRAVRSGAGGTAAHATVRAGVMRTGIAKVAASRATAFRAGARAARGTAAKAGAVRTGAAGRAGKASSALRTAARMQKAARLRQRPGPLLRSRRAVRGRRGALTPQISTGAYQAGWRAGLEDGARISIEQEPYQKKALNRHWMQHAQAKTFAGAPWGRFSEASKGYVHGFFRAKNQHAHDWVLLPTAKSVAAIVSVRNEESTIGPIMHQLNRLPFDEVYVIVNGSVDHSFQRVRERSHAVVLSFPEPLGHDVGRALGAKLASADILLFLDGDIMVTAEELLPFIGGIDQGLDVALNDITPYMHSFAKQDQVTHMKQFLNASLGRSDLGANSLTAVPHALSRKALDVLGIPALMVPPKAQALAVHHHLNIKASGSINVIRSNKRRTENTGRTNQVADLIIGDHVEALKLAGDLSGERLSFRDEMRKRTLAGGAG